MGVSALALLSAAIVAPLGAGADLWLHCFAALLPGALHHTLATLGPMICLVLSVSVVGIYNIIGGNSSVQELLAGLDPPPLDIIFVMMAMIVLNTLVAWIAIVFITIPIVTNLASTRSCSACSS
jgi:TRAP-type mannitol/chloroaromatic compound transport system permease large subunit